MTALIAAFLFIQLALFHKFKRKEKWKKLEVDQLRALNEEEEISEISS